MKDLSVGEVSEVEMENIMPLCYCSNLFIGVRSFLYSMSDFSHRANLRLPDDTTLANANEQECKPCFDSILIDNRWYNIHLPYAEQ